MYKLLIATAAYLFLLYSGSSSAGGPLIIEGPNGNTAVSYEDSDIFQPGLNITLNVENGDLGALTNAAANNLVQQALNLWNNVATSSVALNLNTTAVNVDVDNINYDTYIPANISSTPRPDDNLNPLIYDNDGSIIDAFFGIQSGTILGFSASSIFKGASYFNEGFVVINGSILNYSDTDYVLLFAHEIGHFFGLDHSQVNIDNQETNGSPSFCSTSINNLSTSNYPVMYPIACRSVGTLHSDDISALSALYPKNSAPNADFSILNGRLTDQSGNAILGANLWVEDNSGMTYSIVSDYLKQGTGFYQLLLPAGNYTLYANSINPEFNGGSSIGPYSLTTEDLSFTCADGITPTVYEGNTPGNAEVITISVNQTTVINFSLSAINIDACATAPPTTVSSDKKGSGTLSVSGLSILFLLLASYRLSYRTRPLSQASLKW
jgi:hypothetical protein